MKSAEGADEAGAPRTVVGRWLLATMLRKGEDELRLSRMLNGGKRGWNQDEPAVIEIACEFALRRYFRSSVNVDEITEFVKDIRERVHSTEPPGQSETEAVVRRALGDSGVAAPRIPAAEVSYIHGTVLSQVVARRNLSRTEIYRLIERAERQALKRGWKPPLYPEEKLP